MSWEAFWLRCLGLPARVRDTCSGEGAAPRGGGPGALERGRWDPQDLVLELRGPGACLVLAEQGAAWPPSLEGAAGRRQGVGETRVLPGHRRREASG